MMVAFRIPRVFLRCDRCEATALPSGAYMHGDRSEIELPCRCAVPELMLCFGYPEQREPVAKLPLDRSADPRQLAESRHALGG